MKKMEDDLKKKWKTNQSTKINLIGCDAIVNSPSLLYLIFSFYQSYWICKTLQINVILSSKEILQKYNSIQIWVVLTELFSEKARRKCVNTIFEDLITWVIHLNILLVIDKLQYLHQQAPNILPMCNHCKEMKNKFAK